MIGERCRHVSAADAASVIAGYTIVNDVSVRDWQNRTRQFTMGKSFDTHGPMGPAIVTGDELGNPHVLGIRTFVNGELRQNSNTEHLIFDCYDIVEYLSTAFTLEPGDVIATGTPSGVAGRDDPAALASCGRRRANRDRRHRRAGKHLRPRARAGDGRRPPLVSASAQPHGLALRGFHATQNLFSDLSEIVTGSTRGCGMAANRAIARSQSEDRLARLLA